MRRWGITLTIVVVFVAGIVLSVTAIRTATVPKVDIVAINEVAKQIEGNWGHFHEIDGSVYDQPFTVIDHLGNVLYQTDQNVYRGLHDAIRNRDAVIDLMKDGHIAGKLIIHSQDVEIMQQLKKQLMTVLIVTFAVLAVLCFLYALHIHATLIRPFKKLQRFAVHVARGVLDLPLVMDKHHHFGAFTESFDMMREELAAARQREYEANRSKKELVASLSHDIKTPVASIKAVTELMLLRATEDKLIHQLNTIHSKAEQIDGLITDMFHATLEELQELKVTVTEESSAILTEMMESVNFDDRIRCDPIPECLILMDAMRLQQVLDNVISNAYKYAGTSVSIHCRITAAHLELHIKDYGQGVHEDELPLVFNKFYRGNNAEGKSGSGLGLYLSNYFMQHMQGEMECLNRQDGFTVILKLKLA